MPGTSVPEFVKRLEDVEVVDGQEVMLFCVVRGHPMPNITWYHNDKNIASNDEYVFTYDRQTGHVYLVILDCLADDEGEFRCVATNAAGQVVTQCLLRILSAEQAAASIKPLVQPLVISTSSVQRGASATGVLSSTGDAASSKPRSPAVQPLVIKASSAANVLSPTRDAATFRPVSPVVQPPLVINATSVQRDATSRTNVLSPTASKGWQPKPPPSVVISSDDSLPAAVNGHPHADSLTLMPRDILYHTKKIPGQSRKVASYRTVLRRASDNDLLGYRGKSGELHRRNVAWKVSDWSGAYDKQTVERVQLTQAKLAHSSLQPTSSAAAATTSFQTFSTESYSAANSKIPSFAQPPSKVSHVKAPAESSTTSFTAASSRLFEPPRFIVPLVNQKVRDGEAATLRVRFHGNPTPKLRWFFNQKIIEDEEDFVIRSDLVRGESLLWIKEVFPEDDGEFVCKAENDYGSAVTHCRLTVQCMYSIHVCFYFSILTLLMAEKACSHKKVAATVTKRVQS